MVKWGKPKAQGAQANDDTQVNANAQADKNTQTNTDTLAGKDVQMSTDALVVTQPTEIPDDTTDQSDVALPTNVLKWFVTIDGTTYADEVKIPGDETLGDKGGSVVRVHCDVPAGRIERVMAQLSLNMTDNDRAFFNGFQTWTYCPEYQKTDKMQNMNRVPKMILKKYHLDRYGDSYFVTYPDGPGMFHGFSWCYFRNGDSYRLLASLDERPGYTIFGYDANRGILTIERDCEGVLHEGGELAAFDLFVAEGDEYKVFDAWFAAMECTCRAALPLKGYSSWYNRYENISQEDMLSDLENCADVFGPGDLFQIDDGWEPEVGDWLDTDKSKFPDGMKPLVDAIHKKGFKAGLWLAPFVAEKESSLFKEHSDWFLMVDGEPWACGCNWSGFYSLDIDNSEVIDYLESVFKRVFDEWGFDLVKLDFLYGAAPFGTEKESRAGRMYRALEMLRQWTGDKLILGCGVPVMPAFGIVDYCRVGCDVSLNWNGDWYLRPFYRERVSTKNAIQDAYFRRQLDRRAYGSDPDVYFLRDENVDMSWSRRKKLARSCAQYGSVFLTSDDPANWSKKAQKLYKRLLKIFYKR